MRHSEADLETPMEIAKRLERDDAVLRAYGLAAHNMLQRPPIEVWEKSYSMPRDFSAC